MRKSAVIGQTVFGSSLSIEEPRRKELIAFQKRLGLRFRSLELLNLSFMHRSVKNEFGITEDNERLEFLGDSILGAITATLLYKEQCNKNEGELAKIKSVVVSEEILSSLALQLQIEHMLLLGKGEEKSGGREKKAILADTFEAFLGAMYLDSGYESCFKFLRPLIASEIDRVLANRHRKDFKTELQEYCQRTWHSYPEYKILKKSGPEHERMFSVEVEIHGKAAGVGTGKSKKEAEQAAAKMAFENLMDL